MSQTYRLEELDEATRGYLATAKENRAAGLPGVYLEKSGSHPAAALFWGFVLVILTLLATVPSTEDETRTAMLQTAGFVLGGWLILYPFRIWLAQARGSNLGTFWYADPNYVWMVEGSTVTAVPTGSLRDVRAVRVVGGNSPRLTVLMGSGNEAFRNPKRDAAPAALFVDFLNVLKALRTDRAEEAATLTAAQLGNGALKIARDGRFTEVIDRTGGGLQETLPLPQKANRGSSGLLSMALITAAFVGLFLGLRRLNVTLRDDAAFAQAKDAGPLGLREYLFDERNTLHREEASGLLDKAFEKALRTIPNRPGIDRPRAEAFVQVVNRIRGEGKCLLAVCARELPNPALPPDLAEASSAPTREAETLKEIQNKIIAALEPPGLIGLYETTDPERAHLDFTWKFLPAQKGPGVSLQWTLALRAEVGGKPIYEATEIKEVNLGPGSPAPLGKDLLPTCVEEVFQKMFGKGSGMPVIPFDGGN